MTEVNAQKIVDDMALELRGVQEMLYQVLRSVGEPVVVSKEAMRKGIDSDYLIEILEDEENDSFIFKLRKPDA